MQECVEDDSGTGVSLLFLRGKWSEERVGWQVCTMSGHLKAVVSVTFSPDGKRVISGSRDRSVKIWKLVTILNATTGADVSRFVDVR